MAIEKNKTGCFFSKLSGKCKLEELRGYQENIRAFFTIFYFVQRRWELFLTFKFSGISKGSSTLKQFKEILNCFLYYKALSFYI